MYVQHYSPKSSAVPPKDSILFSRKSNKMVAKVADVVGFAKDLFKITYNAYFPWIRSTKYDRTQVWTQLDKVPQSAPL